MSGRATDTSFQVACMLRSMPRRRFSYDVKGMLFGCLPDILILCLIEPCAENAIAFIDTRCSEGAAFGIAGRMNKQIVGALPADVAEGPVVRRGTFRRRSHPSGQEVPRPAFPRRKRSNAQS
jgi:hypothetical protein